MRASARSTTRTAGSRAPRSPRTTLCTTTAGRNPSDTNSRAATSATGAARPMRGSAYADSAQRFHNTPRTAVASGNASNVAWALSETLRKVAATLEHHDQQHGVERKAGRETDKIQETVHGCLISFLNADGLVTNYYQ